MAKSYGFTEADIRAYQNKAKGNVQVKAKKPVARHKFNAKPTINDGIRFDSKLEAKYYEKLKWLQNQGEVVFFLRQPAFHLPGNVKYSADFQVFYASGEVEFIDVKGILTKEFQRAKKQVEALYPIEIKVVKKGDF